MPDPGVTMGLIAEALPPWLWLTAAGSTAVLVLLVRTWRRLEPKPLLQFNLIHDQRGTATLEFTMLLPLVLFFGLLLAQVMWLGGGNLMVHYAAQAATRSAIVQIPQEYPDSEANQYTHGDSKYQRIKLSAIMAVMPVSGPASAGAPFGGGSNVNPQQIAEGIRRHYTAHGMEVPPWVDNYVAHHVAYAAANTDVVVHKVRVNADQTVDFLPITSGPVRFDPKEPIGVFVYHNLYLPIPFVRRIFADEGAKGHDALYGTQEGLFTRVQAHFILTNEGMVDRRPEEPSLPRRNP